MLGLTCAEAMAAKGRRMRDEGFIFVVPGRCGLVERVFGGLVFGSGVEVDGPVQDIGTKM